MTAVVTPLQLGGLVGLFVVLVLAGPLAVAVGWALATDDTGPGWRRLLDHPEVSETGRYGDDPPEIETVVRGRRVVARVETAPGGNDRFAVLQTAMLAVRAGTGFELAERDGSVAFVDRGPDIPPLPDSVWTAADEVPAFGGLTVDDRTGVVEHRFPDPGAVADPETLLSHAELLVTVAETVEAYAEDGDETADPGAETAESDSDGERSAVEESERA